ncbi:MAG TPA: LAGLIDADG family homing endonuclease, partial [Patescibacteria group bacterium]
MAYIVGLITADGCLSNDGRHIIFVSKDLEQVQNFSNILKLEGKIALKKGGYTGRKEYYFVQFSNVNLYRFLVSLGLHPNKSKSLGKLSIPDDYFADFLRGCLDGDGFTYSYLDKRWRSSFMLYTGFTCASYDHLNWMNESIYRL